MYKQSLPLLAFLLCFYGATLAQNEPASNGQQFPEFIQIDAKESAMEKTGLFQKYYKLQSADELRMLRAEQDALGFTHEKFQQYFKGLIVDGATVTVHSKGGSVTMLSGNYAGIGELSIVPAITTDAAFEFAEKHVGAQHYKWEEPLGEHNDYEKPKGELVVAFDFLGKEPARLAYKFDIYASEPLYRAYVFIDAHTGAFIRENKRIHHTNIAATGTSLYNGNVSFTADNTGSNYRLRQTSSGNGIQTFNMNNGGNYGTATDFTSATTNFTGDATGVEAHWCSEKTYGYFFTQHGRNSYNNAGAIIKSYVHYGNSYANAFWDGSRMTYGDGGDGISPLVTLDICGHEVSHAVTEYSAGLVYSNDPGALNESFSDIFGECVENFGAGVNNWLLGDEIGVIIRSMANPNSQGQPDTYLGTDWYTGGDQDYLVHTNSGVQNKWFYVLTVGENGTNDNGHAYCVEGIGLAKAAAIAYRNLTVYLSANSNYAAARTGAIQAARDLYGVDSPEEVATTNAWRAVGVGAGFGPKITCPSSLVVGNTPNLCSAVVNYSTPSGLANCPTVTQTAGIASGATFPLGVTTNVFRVTDVLAATSTCTFTVTVNDTQGPTIICPANVSVAANAACQATLASYIALATANDNCAAPAKTQLPAAGTTINIGATTVTLKSTDGVGLTGTCVMTVTVVDAVPPSIACPASVSVAANASCQATLASYTGSATASDNCSTPTKTQLPVAGATIGAGITTVILTATDGAGSTASCTMTVNVIDQTPPSITCPANASVSANATCQASLPNYTASATASDNCSTPAKTQLPVAGTTINLGATTLTLRATDGAGLSASCTFTVTVVDNTPPAVVCKSVNVVLNAAGTASITMANVFESATDNCGTINQVSVTPNTFNCSNLGLNTVTLQVNDGHGNNGSCTTQAKVLDNLAPTILCQNVTVNLNAGGTAAITPAQVNNGSSDNCTISLLTLSQTTFTCANIGFNTVTLTGKDQSANTATCTATVTVVDGIAPVALCKNAVVLLNAAGTVTVAGSSVNNGSSDNCSFTLTVTPGTFTCANIGTNIITLKATDPGGNTATCTAAVTVRDNVAPAALCKNPTIYLNSNGQASITPADINNGSSDACGILSMAININTFNCSNLPGSPVPVLLTLTDVNTNTSTCLSQVSVKDNLAPTAVCENTTVVLNAQGKKPTVYGANLAANSYDNCSVWSYSPTAKLYTTANLGVNNLTITVKDWSNNAATCVSQVTVLPYGSFGNQNMVANNGGEQGIFAEGMELSVYPNPGDRNVTVAFQLPQDQPISLRLFDATGKLALSQNTEGMKGENVLPLDLSRLPIGLYIVDIQSDVLREQKRFAVQR